MLKPTQKNSKLIVMTAVFSILFSASPSVAEVIERKLLQILHTNDLHAAMKSNGPPHRGELEYGGWARIKKEMDRLATAAKDAGIETIRLDAGDFLEGTLYYFPDNGEHVMKAFQDMKYDAAALGNHDWLMGARGMNALFSKIPGMTKNPFPILSANVKFSEHFKGLKQFLKPSIQIKREGMRIGVFGLSTNEILYSWIPHSVGATASEFGIGAYHDHLPLTERAKGWVGMDAEKSPGIASRMIRQLKHQEKNDLVIALTHIGVQEDTRLAQESTDLDLIVGGHSHEVIDRLKLVENKNGEMVPIVQTGANGKYIGKIIVEINPGKRARVLTYELIEVLANGPEDPQVKADVQAAEAALNQLYSDRGCLDDVIGTSEVRLVSGSFGPTTFGKFAADSIREAANTDFAIDIGAFNGISHQPSGIITRRTLMEMYPRKFESHRNEGLYIYKALIKGARIRQVLERGLEAGYYVSFSGLSYRTPTPKEFDIMLYEHIQKSWGKDFNSNRHKKIFDELKRITNPRTPADERARLSTHFPIDIRIGGKPLDEGKLYSVAASESAIRGLYGLMDELVPQGKWITNKDKIVMKKKPVSPAQVWANTMSGVNPHAGAGLQALLVLGDILSYDSSQEVEGNFARWVLMDPQVVETTMWESMENHLRKIGRITRLDPQSVPFPINDDELDEGSTHNDPRWGEGANPISISVGDALKNITGVGRSNH